MADGPSATSCTRWCSFTGIRGLDRVLRRAPTRAGLESRCSLPLSRRQDGTDEWSADPFNIVVFGAPGTGKSTLALDMAAKLRTVDARLTVGRHEAEELGRCEATNAGAPCTVLYYGLEQSPESLARRFRMLAVNDEGRGVAIPIIDVPSRDDGPGKWVQAYGEDVGKLLFAPTDALLTERLPNLVLFPSVTPRTLEDTGEAQDGGADSTSIFWRRYAEIRHLIESLQEQERKAGELAVGLSPCAFCKTKPDAAKSVLNAEVARFLNHAQARALRSAHSAVEKQITAIPSAADLQGDVRESAARADALRSLERAKAVLGLAANALPKEVPDDCLAGGNEATEKARNALREWAAQYAPGSLNWGVTVAPLRMAHACICAAVAAMRALKDMRRQPAGQGGGGREGGSDSKDPVAEALDNLEKAVRELSFLAPIPPLRMVVIDSLSMLGDKPVTRYLVDQLFALFTEKNVVGVFVVEERGGALPDADSAPAVPSDVCFSADVVMRLGWTEWEGYAHRTLEVTKSRHSPNTYGRQWIKVRDQGVEVYPSLHNWFTYLHSEGDGGVTERKDAPSLAVPGLSKLDPDAPISSHPVPPSSIVLISGPGDTGKASLAARYAWGAGAAGTPSFLLVSLAEGPNPQHQATRFGQATFVWQDGDAAELAKILRLSPSKGRLSQVLASCHGKAALEGYQLWLAPGYLLAEELVWYVDQCLNRIGPRSKGGQKVTRVIVMDVGHIPSRHPALARQILDGTGNFFPVLQTLFEHHRVDGVFVCSTDDRRRNLLPLLKPMAHHCIELRHDEPEGGSRLWAERGSIHAVVSGRWVKGRRHEILSVEEPCTQATLH